MTWIPQDIAPLPLGDAFDAPAAPWSGVGYQGPGLLAFSGGVAPIIANASRSLPFGVIGAATLLIAASAAQALPLASTGTAVLPIAAESVVSPPFNSAGAATLPIAASSVVSLPFNGAGAATLPIAASSLRALPFYGGGVASLAVAGASVVTLPLTGGGAASIEIAGASEVPLPLGSAGAAAILVSADGAVPLPFAAHGTLGSEEPEIPIAPSAPSGWGGAVRRHRDRKPLPIPALSAIAADSSVSLGFTVHGTATLEAVVPAPAIAERPAPAITRVVPVVAAVPPTPAEPTLAQAAPLTMQGAAHLAFGSRGSATLAPGLAADLAPSPVVRNALVVTSWNVTDDNEESELLALLAVRR